MHAATAIRTVNAAIPNKSLGILLELFWTFARIGLFTFGGGYAMIALIEHACVEQKGWITHDEMMDVTVIAESTPGPIAINCATFVGYKQRGLAGAVVATVGMVLPSFVIILLVMALLKKMLQNPYAQAVLRGVKPCIVGIILATGLFFVFRNCFGSVEAPAANGMAVLLTVALALVYFGSRKVLKKGLSPIGLIGLAALAGMLVYGVC